MTLPGDEPTAHHFSDRTVIVLIVISFVVLVVVSFQVKKSQDTARSARATAATAQQLSREVHHQAATIRQLRHVQAASCANFETLKGAVNDFHGTIRDFLRQMRERSQTVLDNPVGVAPSQIEAARKAVASANRLLRNTHTVTATCAQKPVKAHAS